MAGYLKCAWYGNIEICCVLCSVILFKPIGFKTRWWSKRLKPNNTVYTISLNFCCQKKTNASRWCGGAVVARRLGLFMKYYYSVSFVKIRTVSSPLATTLICNNIFGTFFWLLFWYLAKNFFVLLFCTSFPHISHHLSINHYTFVSLKKTKLKIED